MRGPTARKTPLGHASPPPRGKSGPAPWKATKAIRFSIENMVILGIDDVAIARFLNIHVDTLRKHCQHELDTALVKMGQESIGNLRELSGKDVRANQYMLGNRFGKGSGIAKHAWQDTRSVEVQIDHNRPDLSRASPEQLAVLREAAQVMAHLREPGRVIEHVGIAASSETGQDAADGD